MHRNMNVLRLGKISRAARRGRDDATAEHRRVRWGKVWIVSRGKATTVAERWIERETRLDDRWPRCS
jgi:hypothetical protein